MFIPIGTGIGSVRRSNPASGAVLFGLLAVFHVTIPVLFGEWLPIIYTNFEKSTPFNFDLIAEEFQESFFT